MNDQWETHRYSNNSLFFTHAKSFCQGIMQCVVQYGSLVSRQYEEKKKAFMMV